MAHSILDSLFGELSEKEFCWDEISFEKCRLRKGTLVWLHRDFGKTCSLHTCRSYLCNNAWYEVLHAINRHIAKRFADNAEGHESYDLLCKEIKNTAPDSDIGEYIYSYLNDRMYGF